MRNTSVLLLCGVLFQLGGSAYSHPHNQPDFDGVWEGKVAGVNALTYADRNPFSANQSWKAKIEVKQTPTNVTITHYYPTYSSTFSFEVDGKKLKSGGNVVGVLGVDGLGCDYLAYRETLSETTVIDYGNPAYTSGLTHSVKSNLFTRCPKKNGNNDVRYSSHQYWSALQSHVNGNSVHVMEGTLNR